MAARRKIYGWGTEDQVVAEEETVFLARLFAQKFGATLKPPQPSPKVGDFALRAPRVEPRAAVGGLHHTPMSGWVHAYGKSL
jgi:hypothetical protein